MSKDARLRRKILNGIVRRLDLAGRATKDLAGRAIEELSTPELRQMSDRELEGALSYAIGLRAEGERLRREVFREQAERRQRLAEQAAQDGGAR